MKTIQLSRPIQQGDQTVDEIKLRDPKAGDMMGIKLSQVMNMDAAHCLPLLERINDNGLMQADLLGLHCFDLAELMGQLVDFFVRPPSEPAD